MNPTTIDPNMYDEAFLPETIGPPMHPSEVEVCMTNADPDRLKAWLNALFEMPVGELRLLSARYGVPGLRTTRPAPMCANVAADPWPPVASARGGDYIPDDNYLVAMAVAHEARNPGCFAPAPTETPANAT